MVGIDGCGSPLPASSGSSLRSPLPLRQCLRRPSRVFCTAAALALALLVALQAVRAAYVGDPAVHLYTKALRGGAAPKRGRETPQLRQLANLHYVAVRHRRARQFDRASALYRRAIRLTSACSEPVPDVTRAAAAAHASLCLALSEQGEGNFDKATNVFKDGAALVKDLLRSDLQVWIDGHSRIHADGYPPHAHGHVQVAFFWLATLLTSWALLETKRGHGARARLLVQRAAALDDSKAQVLRWKIVSVDCGREFCSA